MDVERTHFLNGLVHEPLHRGFGLDEYGIGTSICMCSTPRHLITPDRRLRKSDRLADRRYQLAIHLRERGRERKFEARQRGVPQDISSLEDLR